MIVRDGHCITFMPLRNNFKVIFIYLDYRTFIFFFYLLNEYNHLPKMIKMITIAYYTPEIVISLNKPGFTV